MEGSFRMRKSRTRLLYEDLSGIRQFDQSPFLDDSSVHQPDQGGDYRSTRTQTHARDRDKGDRNQKHAVRRLIR